MYYKSPDKNSLENISFSHEEMMAFLKSIGYEFKSEKYKYSVNVYHNDTEDHIGDIVYVFKDGKKLFAESYLNHHTEEYEFVRKAFFKELKSSLLSFFTGDR